jgi:hypothetical protein
MVKDPIALFSAPWLKRRFGLSVVILVREPVSFVGSLRERGWTFDFRHWSEQPALMSGLLRSHAAEIEEQVARQAAAEAPADIVGEGIVQWNAFYGAVDQLRAEDPEMIVVHYETLAANPQEEVESLYQRLRLRFGQTQRDTVTRLTTGSGSGTSAIDVRRDSQAALTTWKSRLSEADINRIRAGTAVVADRFGIAE